MAQAVGWNLVEYIRPFLHPKDQGNLPLFARFVTDHLPAISVCLGLTGPCVLALILALNKEAWGWVFACLTTLTVVAFLLVQSTLHPTLAQDRTFKPFMARVSRMVDAKTPLFFYRSFDYGALFYARRHIPRFEDPSSSGQVFLLMWEEEWERIKPISSSLSLSPVDISEGTGPKGNHRLVLVSVTDSATLTD